MAIQVVLFLLVFFLLLGLALLWRLSQKDLQPAHSQAGAVRASVHRLRHRHAPLVTALPVVLPPFPRQVEGQRICLCDPGVR